MALKELMRSPTQSMSFQSLFCQNLLAGGAATDLLLHALCAIRHQETLSDDHDSRWTLPHAVLWA